MTFGGIFMQKIIYFDEGSATDILQIEYGGELVSVDENKGLYSMQGKGSASVEAGLGTNFFTAIKAAFSVKLHAETSSAKDSLVSKTISNTILADFYKLSSSLKVDNKISIFESYKIRPIKNSFAFLKMFTPYMKVFKEDSPLLEEMKDFDIHNFDQILESAKGYYELLAYKDDNKIILRFNNKEFRNAYSLMDLLRMELNYYAVEVGVATETEYNVENEMDIDKQSARLLPTDMLDEGERQQHDSEEILKVYDVILAGVEAK